MTFARRTLCTMALLVLTSGSPTAAQEEEGVWFDIGVNEATYVNSADGLSWEYFPPYPFGEFYPPGTLVYANVSPVGCDQLPLVDCASTRLVAAYSAFFSDGGCGCGGFLLETARFRVSYDDATLQSLGVTESELQIVHHDWEAGWVPLENLVVNTEENFIEGDTVDWILSTHYYAVTAGSPTPVQRTTWGRIKAQW